MAEPGLLLIRGLGHSGSTILDLALGAHPQLIGLGEAVRVLERPRLGEEHKGPQQPTPTAPKEECTTQVTQPGPQPSPKEHGLAIFCRQPRWQDRAPLAFWAVPPTRPILQGRNGGLLRVQGTQS